MQRRTAVERGMTLKAIDEARRLLSSEAFTETAVLLSGGTDLAEAYRTRLLRAIDTFTQHFGSDREIAVFSAPGRTELGGNHTDHQRGHVLAASINLDVIAVVARRTDRTICVKSEGFPADVISLDELEPVTDQKPTAAELIRGAAAWFQQYGCPLDTGFDAYTTSQVMPGSGLSSSAAFEVLLGNICNALYADNRFTPVELAQMGQYAENVYFHKPCGLMDQMASSVGGAVAIDFANPVKPVVHPVKFDFSSTGYALCIVDTGGNHADLTEEYAAIPREMGAVAKYFGKDVLSEVKSEQVLRSIPELRKACGDRAVLRAMHFYREDGRARANRMPWSVGTSRRSCTWCRTPANPPTACCKMFTRPLCLRNSRSPSPLQLARQCWADVAPSGYTAAVSAEQCRHLYRLCCCPSSGTAWRLCWARAAATCCRFAPSAA